MDLDEMLRVDTTDVGTWTNWLTFGPDPDCFLWRISAATRNFIPWRHLTLRLGLPSMQRGGIVKCRIVKDSR